MDKKSIIIFSVAPYGFDEYIKPIVISLISQYKINLVQTSFYLNKSSYLIEELNNLKKNNKDFTYEIIDVPKENISLKSFIYYKNIFNKFQLSKYKYIFLVNDFTIFDLYLIFYARIKNIKTVLLFCNTLRKSFFENIQYKNRNINKFSKINFKEKILKKIITKFIFRNFLFFFNQKISFIIKKFIEFLNFKILPFIILGQVFKLNKFSKHACPQGNCDYTFIFDKLDYELLSKSLKNKNLYLVNHPSIFYKKYYNSKTNETENSNKALILFSCYDKELPTDQFDYWINSVIKSKKAFNINSFNIRFHPRTKGDLVWPKKIIEKMESLLNFKVQVIDTNNKSIIQDYSDYSLILGSISGSLKSLSSYFNGKVLCLLNSNGYYDQKKFLLGSGENIIFIENYQQINKNILNSYKKYKNKINFIETFLKIDQKNN